MKTLSLQEAVKAIKGTLLTENDECVIKGVSTDSRNVGSGDIFFALKGDRFDGHNFISGVLEKGCPVLVVSEKDMIPPGSSASFILVSDTLKAYQELARYYKELISPITIAITGSVGKTSLKDMVSVISKDRFNTVSSVENENNHIGVPKTIFRMEDNTEVLILEMGMSGKDEIRLLADIGRPDIAAVTNIGYSHIENFSGRDGIFDAKMEITSYFGPGNTLVVNGDDPYLGKVGKVADYEVITAGGTGNNDYDSEGTKYLDDTHITFLIDYDKGVERFTLPIAGLYNGTTAALAAAIMSKLNVSVVNCAHSLSKLRITPHRLELKRRKGLKIIDDTYNASPASMKSAMEYLGALESRRKIAVLADMKELGSMSLKLHGEVGAFVGSSGIDYLFTVGELGREIAAAAGEKMGGNRVFPFGDRDSCIAKLRETVKEGDGILIKGSHSMEMDRVVNAL